MSGLTFVEGVEIINKEDSCKVLGDNSHPALSLEGLGDNLLGLFFGLVRKKNEECLIKEVKNILDGKSIEEIKNLFLVAFQTRWCRGGKGERKLFYVIFSELYDYYPEVCLELLELVPYYGYWKDLRNFYFYHFEKKKGEDDILFQRIVEILQKQLEIDLLELENNKESPKISLLAKYYSSKKCFEKMKQKKKEEDSYEDSDDNVIFTPLHITNLDEVIENECKDNVTMRTLNTQRCKRTERSVIENKFFQELSQKIYNPKNILSSRSVNYAEMTLRKKMVMLRKVLEIPEVKMCSNKWSEIHFEKIASLCLSRNSRAFLDEDKSGKIRHPEDEVRKLCRENLIESLKKGVNGSQLNPNELVEKVYKENISPAIAAVANCQWDSMFKNIQEQIQKRINEVGSSNFDLTKCVVMSDVSGSMAGTPMMVSIGFGILVSQLSHDAFKDLVMTFDDNPVFHNLRDKLTFVDKVKHLEKAPWGSSTNFEKAMNLIIKIIEKNKLKENDIPQSLLVISDMQFNDATGGTDYLSEERGSGWGTSFDNIKNMFKKLGERLYGHSINPPQIIFWNVRADTIGYPAGADEPGVTLLSGYSPALLKFIFSGELEEEVEVVDENGETRKVKVKLSPKETLQKILSEKALDPVRVIVDKL